MEAEQSMKNTFISDDSDLQNKYPKRDEYEQYHGRYDNSILYTSKPLFTQFRGECDNSYRPEFSCSIMDSQGKIGLPTEDSDEIGIEDQEKLTQNARYIHPRQYDDMSEYGNTAFSACNIEPQYIDNGAVSFNYVSEANYGILSEAINTNSFSTRTLLIENTLNSSNTLPQITQKISSFETNLDYENKMSQLNLNPLDVLRAAKDDFIDSSSTEMCSTMRWRDPNLSEVISFLNNPNNTVKSNAAAYLQHLCYMDDPNKQRTRILGGIPPLIHLLAYDMPEIQKNACGALRNLSYGRQNDENKRAIKNAGGITALVNLLCRTTESEVKELVTGVLWNMSSCEDIKPSIVDECLSGLIINVIKPHSGWDPKCPGEICFSTVFRNATGILRNVSSAGEFARKSLRESKYLVECLLYVLKAAIDKNNIGNKTVENCVCILRNLSYRLQEVEDPNYDKQYLALPIRSNSSTKEENLGCFGASRKKKETNEEHEDRLNSSLRSTNAAHSADAFKCYDQLWHPDVIQYYLSLLQSCSNPETLEAAAGAIQNLSACYWQPSIDIRATVRKEKGLPILVELLRMEVDRVVCAVATALRNLAIDQRNKELIGKYAMRDLVQKLPSGNTQHDQCTSDDTISAVLATINEVIRRNPEFSRSLLDAGGVERLINITRKRERYTSCVLKFGSQVLFTMWQHHELRDAYKKCGWKEQDFVTKYVLSQHSSPNSPNNPNNTLNRPMASQSRTRYEDRTIQRSRNNHTIRTNGGVCIDSVKCQNI